MATIKENVSNNIVLLRKSRQWTQADLAEMLNYSDKTISKWERGESTPDIEMIYQMSQLFEVPIEYFFQENESITEEVKMINQKIMFKNLAKISLWIIVVWFIGICIFIYQNLFNKNGTGYWLSFIWPIPASCVIAFLYFIKYKYFICIPYTLSILVWSILASIYLQFLVFGINIWLIFLIGIPMQLIIIITYWLKK